MYNSADNWVLGEPFFRSFYSVYDDSKGIIGLAPSINYLKAGIFEGVVPNDELPYARKSKTDKQQQKPNKPAMDLSDPLSVVGYMAETLKDDLLGT